VLKIYIRHLVYRLPPASSLGEACCINSLKTCAVIGQKRVPIYIFEYANICKCIDGKNECSYINRGKNGMNRPRRVRYRYVNEGSLSIIMCKQIWGYIDMGCLRLVGSFKLQVSFAEYRLFYRALLQKRPMFLRTLLIVAIPYSQMQIGWHRMLRLDYHTCKTLPAYQN